MPTYRNFCDEKLVIFLIEGDERAFTELYRRHWQSMFNTAHKRLQSIEQSQDIVQTIFADLWERKGKVYIENVQAYLHTAVRFQVFKHASREPGNQALFESFEQTLAAAGQPDDVMAESEALQMLDLWIAALPEKRREIFLLHYFENHPTSEIAQRLDISQKTVQNQLNTAANAIRARLEKILLLGGLSFSIFFERP